MGAGGIKTGMGKDVLIGAMSFRIMLDAWPG